MEYRKLGATGISVSVIGFGPQMYMFGTEIPEETEELTYNTLKRALELGVNFIDLAEFYGGGLLEIFVGNSLRKLNVNRQDIVVTTKIWHSPLEGVNCRGCSRKRLTEGLKASLNRLQMDYVDIVFADRFDYETSLEEVCRAMDHLIKTERALYWGTSEWSAKQIIVAQELCEKLGLHKPVLEQTQYNMMHRERVEGEYAELLERNKLVLSVYSPLAGGLLTGKHIEDPDAGRFSDVFMKEFYHFEKWFGEENREKTKTMFQEFEKIARELGGTITQLALAWVLRNKDVSTMICGFTKVEQVDSNLKAIEMYQKWTPEIEEKIEKLLLMNDSDEKQKDFGKQKVPR